MVSVQAWTATGNEIGLAAVSADTETVAARSFGAQMSQTIDEESRHEIDRAVARLLRQAEAVRRFPTPVDDLITAQKLHLSTGDDSPFAPSALNRAPAALRERLTGIVGKLLGALDRRDRHVYVAPDSLDVQRRFTECHELGHDLCPWQAIRYHVDGHEQLAFDVDQRFEAEANYAAVGLLFQQSVFTEVAASYPISTATIKKLAEVFGASIHATLHQFVERSPHAVAGLVLPPSPSGTSADTYRFLVKQRFTSPSFARRFSLGDACRSGLATAEHPGLARAWDQLRLHGPVGYGHLALTDRDGFPSLLDFELFSNSYNLFLLLLNPR